MRRESNDTRYVLSTGIPVNCERTKIYMDSVKLEALRSELNDDEIRDLVIASAKWGYPTEVETQAFYIHRHFVHSCSLSKLLANTSIAVTEMRSPLAAWTILKLHTAFMAGTKRMMINWLRYLEFEREMTIAEEALPPSQRTLKDS